MILRIKNKGMVPRGGLWKYTQPETKELIVSNDWDMLMRKIKEHRRQHKLPIGLGFEAEIEHHICSNQPDCCMDSDPRVPHLPRLGVSDIVRGLKVLASFKLAGSPLVSQEEANRRAQICSRCRYNVTFSRGCAGCTPLKSLVQSLIGNAHTPYDDALRNCGICGCYTQSHVWMPLDILDKGLTPEMRAQFLYAREQFGCWKVAETNSPSFAAVAS